MLPECLDRLSHPRMEYYRTTYEDSERWNGVDDLEGKTVIVYCEQGYGDAIQFIRYIPLLKQRGCRVILHCPEILHSLFAQLGVGMIDKADDNLPVHDYHIPSMSLPFVLNQVDVDVPYLTCGDRELGHDGIKIGIAWEGNNQHSNNAERSCPLYYFRTLQQPNVKLYMLQKCLLNLDLIDGCKDMELYGSIIGDFNDTAEMVNSVDFVVTVDTSVLHLAGALGKPTYGLLSLRGDPRWDVGYNWYPTVSLIRQRIQGDWEGLFCELHDVLKKEKRL